MVKVSQRFDLFSYSPFTIYHSLVLRHHFFTTLKDLAHHALLRHGKYLQSVGASLLQLFTLHVGHLRQMPFGPRVFDKLERVVFPERMPFPIRRQQYSAQVGMVSESSRRRDRRPRAPSNLRWAKHRSRYQRSRPQLSPPSNARVRSGRSNKGYRQSPAARLGPIG